MLPSHHAASAVLAGVALRRAGWGWPAVASFAAGAVLIDVDHYLAYAWESGDLSLYRAYWNHRGTLRLRHASRLAFRWVFPFWGGYNRPFHAVPALAALCLAAGTNAGLRPLALGVALHRFLDLLWESFWAAQPRR